MICMIVIGLYCKIKHTEFFIYTISLGTGIHPGHGQTLIPRQGWCLLLISFFTLFLSEDQIYHKTVRSVSLYKNWSFIRDHEYTSQSRHEIPGLYKKSTSRKDLCSPTLGGLILQKSLAKERVRYR